MVLLTYDIVTDYKIICINNRFSINIKTYQDPMLPLSCGIEYDMEKLNRYNDFLEKMRLMGLPDDGFDFIDIDLALYSYEIPNSKRYYGSYSVKFDKETTEMMKLVLNIYSKKQRFIMDKID
jgi:hypothetical protein